MRFLIRESNRIGKRRLTEMKRRSKNSVPKQNSKINTTILTTVTLSWVPNDECFLNALWVLWRQHLFLVS
jgi:hypothetical protein